MKKMFSYIVVIISLTIPEIIFAGTCYIKVVSSEGNPLANVVVQGTKLDDSTTGTFTTNQMGKTVVRWGDQQSLKAIYIDGQQKSSCKNQSGLTIVKDEIN